VGLQQAVKGAREAGSFSRSPNAGREIFRLPGFLICTWILVNELNVKSFILHCFTGVVAGAVALTGYVISGCSLSKFAPSSRPLSQPTPISRQTPGFHFHFHFHTRPSNTPLISRLQFPNTHPADSFTPSPLFSLSRDAPSVSTSFYSTKGEVKNYG
jgi:hypothetical protein